MKILLLAMTLTVLVPCRASAQMSNAPVLRDPRSTAEKVSMKMPSDKDTRWRLNDCLMRRRDFEVQDVETLKLSSKSSCEIPKKLRATSGANLDLAVEIDLLREEITFTVTLNRGGQGSDESYKDVLRCLCVDAEHVFLSASSNGSGKATRDPDYCQVILKGGDPIREARAFSLHEGTPSHVF